MTDPIQGAGSDTPVVDLRSDTVTRPTPAMLDAMLASPVGDDVLGDDPTVAALEARVAALFGKEAACFVPSGTMANQLGIGAQTNHGDEIIAHEDSHVYQYEGGAPAALFGCTFGFASGDNGMFDADEMIRRIRPDDHHFPRSSLVIVENTANRGGGVVWPIERFRAVSERAREHGLRVHLDGARVWNASVASGVELRAYGELVDSVACCFSKGLGTPAGSVFSADHETIRRARRLRKRMGGVMRQSGLLAGGCLYAIEHHIDRLSEDHENAMRVRDGLAAIDGLTVRAGVETNIVYFDVAPAWGEAPELAARLEEAGVRMLALGPAMMRAVTHLDVDAAMIDRAIQITRSVMRGEPVSV